MSIGDIKEATWGSRSCDQMHIHSNHDKATAKVLWTQSAFGKEFNLNHTHIVQRHMQVCISRRKPRSKESNLEPYGTQVQLLRLELTSSLFWCSRLQITWRPLSRDNKQHSQCTMHTDKSHG